MLIENWVIASLNQLTKIYHFNRTNEKACLGTGMIYSPLFPPKKLYHTQTDKHPSYLKSDTEMNI